MTPALLATPLVRKVIVALVVLASAVALAAGPGASLAVTAGALGSGNTRQTQNAAGCGWGEPAQPATQVQDDTLTPEQQANVAIILDTARRLRVPPRGQVVALAAARQESAFVNLPTGHLDSVGLFQQRTGWGSFAERTDPATATRMFFTGGRGGQRGLLDVPGWASMPVAVAAQAVQASRYPDAYARWEQLATRLVGTAAPAAPCVVQAVDLAPVAGSGKRPSADVACVVGGPGVVESAPGGVPIRICTVGSLPVNTLIAANVSRLLADSRAAGLKLGGSAFRSNARQIELRRAHCSGNIFTAPSSSCSPPTAPPGKSMHEWGLALDLTCSGALISSAGSACYAWLVANGSRYGLKQLPSEKWHWSIDGR